MWIVYVGVTMHSAWDKEIQAGQMQGRLEKMGKLQVHYKLSHEFLGCFSNGYIFG